MIILDTNLLSEPLKLRANPNVLAWLDAQSADSLYITTISYAELRFGVLKMPEGSRKTELNTQIRKVLELFHGRILAFDIVAAEQLARLAARCDAIGRPATAPDAYIAAIAATHDFAVATRNVKHFSHMSIQVLNPWEATIMGK